MLSDISNIIHSYYGLPINDCNFVASEIIKILKHSEYGYYDIGIDDKQLGTISFSNGSSIFLSCDSNTVSNPISNPISNTIFIEYNSKALMLRRLGYYPEPSLKSSNHSLYIKNRLNEIYSYLSF